MWTRESLKRDAKASLKGYYWIAFAICLISGIIIGFMNTGSSYSKLGNALNSDSYSEMNLEYLLIFFGIYFTLFFIIMILSIIYSVFIGNIIDVGKKYFFLSGREQKPQFTSLFISFRRGRYTNTLKTTFTTKLYIFLWSLLLIIPGIIKTYEYYMVNYIMAENPELSTKRALEISEYMTEGDKFNIFVLEFSFFGWYILGLLACCVGGAFVNPYYEATFAELYAVKRQEAISSGFVSCNELPGFNN